MAQVSHAEHSMVARHLQIKAVLKAIRDAQHDLEMLARKSGPDLKDGLTEAVNGIGDVLNDACIETLIAREDRDSGFQDQHAA